MNSNSPWHRIKRIILFFRNAFSHQRSLLAKDVYHRIPLPHSWKRKLRGFVRKLLTPSFIGTTKKPLPFDANRPRLNMTHHLGLCSKRIRMRSDLARKNYRTLVILCCADSIQGLSDTLEDLFLSMGKNADLIVLSNFNFAPDFY